MSNAAKLCPITELVGSLLTNSLVYLNITMVTMPHKMESVIVGL